MNEAYAIEIATKWNLTDEGSGYAGFVTEFDIDAIFVSKYTIENVGGPYHNELWVPAEELEAFNEHIIGKIRMTKAYFGKEYQDPENDQLRKSIENHEDKS